MASWRSRPPVANYVSCIPKSKRGNSSPARGTTCRFDTVKSPRKPVHFIMCRTLQNNVWRRPARSTNELKYPSLMDTQLAVGSKYLISLTLFLRIICASIYPSFESEWPRHRYTCELMAAHVPELKCLEKRRRNGSERLLKRNTRHAKKSAADLSVFFFF